MFFGLFHMHRIWALIDRESYASFWMGIMEKKGLSYFVIMGILAGLCILGIITLAIYQLMVDIYKFPKFLHPGLLMALARCLYLI